MTKKMAAKQKVALTKKPSKLAKPGNDLVEKVEAMNRSQAIIEFNLDGSILTANDNFLKTTGYSLDEVVGKHHRMFCDPTVSGAPEYKQFWEKLAQGEFQAGEYQRVHKSSREIWLMASYNPVLDDAGKPYKVIKFAMDITQAKVELKTRIDIMNVTSIVSEADLKGNILNVNEKFLEVSKYSKEELIGNGHNTTRHPDMPKEVFKQMWATIGRGNIFRGVVKNKAKDGTPYYVDAVIAPIMGDNGKPRKYLGVRYDITAMETERQNMKGIFNAIDSAYAYIEFLPNGNVLMANKNFCSTLQYPQEEIIGKHHRIFVDPAYAMTPAYTQFWADLNAGKTQNGVFKRISKDGREVWIQAVYAPVFDEVGRITKVVKIASDITRQQVEAFDNAGQLDAINKAQAVIEFNMDGSVIQANDNFLKTVGYDLNEIKGKHHRMFCEPEYANSNDYRGFWEKLRRGEFDAGEYLRLGRGGKQVWIQASYNPIFDPNGKPYKVVKYATDITAVKTMIRSMEETANSLASAAAELTSTATQMSSTAEQTNEQSASASAAAAEISSGVKTVATNTEEMAASIKEIARSANESAEMSKQTLHRAQETNRTITQLGASSQEIGNVIKVISSIAQQTNLLALNATIEAARAGDAGKGFAVVANEVKELAKQTAKATEDITNKIGAIQTDSQAAVEAIGGISVAMDRLNSIAGAIAASVEEQTATTNEVSRVVLESTKGVEEIARTVKMVSNSAKESKASSEQTLNASRDLTGLAENLKTLVKKVQAA